MVAWGHPETPKRSRSTNLLTSDIIYPHLSSTTTVDPQNDVDVVTLNFFKICNSIL